MSDLDKRIEVIEKYIEICDSAPFSYFANSSEAKKLLGVCEKLKVLGYEWGNELVSHSHFSLTKGYHIINNGTGHISDKNEWYIVWDNGNIGAYQFVDGSSRYDAIQDIFREFKEELMSYGIVNYDPWNDYIVFDIENGKRIMKDYGDILNRTYRKVDRKCKEVRLKNMKKEYEQLLSTLGEDCE